MREVVSDLCRRADVHDIEATALLGAVSGYVVDSPATARAAIEPLMAAYDFDAAERDGALAFFHAGSDADVDIDPAVFSAELGDLYATRSDTAEQPIEARVRFLDPARDYLVAGVSARRLDRAEGGVVGVEAPLVLETEAAEALAQAVLADRRANAEALAIALGPAHLRLEPGDRITVSHGEAFEIVRIEDAETRNLDVKRVPAGLSAPLRLADPAAPPDPGLAPTPVFALLDLPPLPGAESDERPLAALFASPWYGTHALHAGPDQQLLSERARIAQPAIMGELETPLWPGAPDRWDSGGVLRARLFGGALTSAATDAVLNGANIFAIESANGEWELIQARTCVLVEPGVYELSGLLRGQLGSAHAMRTPHPAGAKIVMLDDKLVRANVGAHEWGEPLLVSAPPQGAAAGDARAATASIVLPHAAPRPWAPAHLRAHRGTDDDVAISWIRCARTGGDGWGAGEPPLGEAPESYLVEILDGAEVVRSVVTATTIYLYAAADQVADFGLLPGSLQIRVGQMGANGAAGLKAALTIAL